jgi:hypothetical protein
MGMEIDSLDIAIKAQAKDVASEVNNLYGALDKVANSLSRSTSGFRSATREAGRMVAAFKSLAKVKLPDFTDTINQVATLGRVLEKVEGKKVSIDVDLNLPKSENQLKWAIDAAAESAKSKSKEISDALIKAFSMGDKTGEMAKARRQLRAAVNEMVTEVNAGFNGVDFSSAMEKVFSNDGSYNKIFKIIEENGKIASETIGDEATMVAASLKSIWYGGVDGIKTKISELSDPTLYDRASEIVSNSVMNAVDASAKNVESAFENIIKAASGKLTLDIDVNQEKIVHDIQSAIMKAAKATYEPVKVNVSVDTTNITKELGSIDTGKLPQVSEAYDKLFKSIQSVHTTLSNSNPINAMINSITRLTNVDLRKFDVERFKAITNTISDLSKVSDASTTITKLVSSLSRLANAGDVVKTTSDQLPAFGDEIKSVFDKISSANVDEVSERVLQAFTKIVTSGKKAEDSAKNLPSITSSIKDFFNEMSKAPTVTDTTLRMVEAYAQLSSSGKNLSSVNQRVSDSLRNVGGSGSSVESGFQRIVSASGSVISAFKRMLSAFQAAVKGIVNGASKIVSTFNKILGATVNPVGAIKKFCSALSDAGNKAGIVAPKLNKVTFSLKNLLQAVLPLMGIRQLFQWGKDAIELSSDLTEVQNVVENSFGSKGTEAINTFARTAKEQFGMTELTAKQIASRFQSMGNAMGLTTGMIAKTNDSMAGKIIKDYEAVGDGMGNMSTRLTMLCADMASFYNVEQETVAQALSAVYTGQTRPLRQFGLDLTQATLAEWALKRGIDAEIDSMTQAEKTMLRYQYVMENTSSIQGDFARTSQTWANQTRLLKQNLQALGGVVGGTLINAFRPFVVALNSALSVVISFAETVGNALGKIFGWKILHTPASNAADVFDTLAEGMENVGSAGEDAASGVDDAASSVDKATSGGSSSGSSGSSGSGSGKTNSGKNSSKEDAAQAEDAASIIEEAAQAADDYNQAMEGASDITLGIDDETVAVVEDLTNATQEYVNTVLGIDELNNLNDGSQYADDVANSMNDAAKAAQEYKNTILGFDELNVLNDVTESANAAADAIKDAEKEAEKESESGVDDEAASRDKDKDKDDKDDDKDDSSDSSDKSGSSSSGKNGSGSSGGSGGSAGSGIADAKGADFQLVDSESWLEDYKSDINSLFELGKYISETLAKALESIDWDSIYEKARNFGKGLADFLNGLITPELFSALGRTIAGAINTALNAADAFLDRFDFGNLGRSLAAGINRFFTNFDFGLASKVFYKSINGIADAIKEAADNIQWGTIGNKISECVRNALLGIQWEQKVFPAVSSLGRGLASYLNGLIHPSTFRIVGETVANVLNTALHFLDNFGSTFNFANFGRSIAAAIKGFFNKWDAGLTAEVFNKFANGIITTMRKAIGGVDWKAVGSKIRVMIEGIDWMDLLKNVGGLLMDAINGSLDLAAGLFDGTPIEDAINEMKTTINDIAGNIDFEKVKDGLQKIWDVGSKFVAGFMEGFTNAIKLIAGFGGIAATFIGWIADGLNKIDPDWAKSLGEGLGVIGASLITIAGANKAIGVISGLVGTLTGVGTAGKSAGDGAAAAASGAGAMSGAMGDAAGASDGLLGKIGGLASNLLTSAGVTAEFTEKVRHMSQVSDDVKFSGLLGVLATLQTKGKITSDQMHKLSEKLYATRWAGDDLSVSADTLRTELGNLGIKTEDLNKISGELAQTLEETGFSAEEQETIFDLLGITIGNTSAKTDGYSKSVEGVKTSSENAKTVADLSPELDKTKRSSDDTGKSIDNTTGKIQGMISTAKNSGAVKNTLGVSIDSVGDSSQKADTKTGTFQSNLFGFIASIAGQSILMAVMGTAFENVGKKAENAQVPIDKLKTKIKDFCSSVSTYASDVQKNAQKIGEGIPVGMKLGVDTKSGELQKTVQNALVLKPQNAIKTGWSISGSSKVTYDYATNIIRGFTTAFSANSNTLTQVMSTMIGNMKKTMVSNVKQFDQAGRELANRIKTGMESVSLKNAPYILWNSMDFTGINRNMSIAGHNAAIAFGNGMRNTHVPSAHVTFTQSTQTTDGKTTTSWHSSVSFYKVGGFPNVGELFMANEDGPEMIGKMGNRNVVANNEQIEKGIERAVVSGMARAFANRIGGESQNDEQQPINIYIGNERLAQVIAKQNKRSNLISGGR